MRGDFNAPGSYDVFCSELDSSDVCEVNSLALSQKVFAYLHAAQQDTITRIITISVPGATSVMVRLQYPKNSEDNTVVATGSQVQITTKAACTESVQLTISTAGLSSSISYPICCISPSFVSPSCACPIIPFPILAGSTVIGSARHFVTEGASNDFDLAAQLTFSSGVAISEIRTWLHPGLKAPTGIPEPNNDFSQNFVVSPADGQYVLYDAGTILRVASLVQLMAPWDSNGFCQESTISERYQWQSSTGSGVAYLQPSYYAPLNSNGENGWYGLFCPSSARSLNSVFTDSVDVVRIIGLTCETDFGSIKDSIAKILSISPSQIEELTASMDETNAEFSVLYSFDSSISLTQVISTLNSATDTCLTDLDASITVVSNQFAQTSSSSSLFVSSLFISALLALAVFM